jgi:hypothetical protein
MSMTNPNVTNANMQNVTVPNLKMSMRHSPECNNVTTHHSAKMPRGRTYVAYYDAGFVNSQVVGLAPD